ncbi:hypothetical protein DUNSADRAFT_11013 [Dunaliella salina]|uniref:Encoded protein n=1 Tax=Dunaliella salina TaxID=3046 RepID=A0ABQ7GE99_DUNSA|nr:hypothetical protein DUNSADRAFT_11013 [Dunaliella salina]|eukprot:KAF5832933.1 hypothetical protein DUNSADRAFT_11013 [Dunaliella salina]
MQAGSHNASMSFYDIVHVAFYNTVHVANLCTHWFAHLNINSPQADESLKRPSFQVNSAGRETRQLRPSKRNPQSTRVRPICAR